MIALSPLRPGTSECVDPDARLMQRAGRGEREAFEQLVDRYYDRVVFVIDHLMGGGSHSEDLAQEVFLRVYRARESYRPQSKFSTWLFVIVNNVVRNARRSLARRKDVLVGEPLRRPDLTVERSLNDHRRLGPLETMLRGELRSTVRAAVDELSGRQRTAILLYHFAGFSYAEVAEHMGTTLCAAKALLHRARTSLRGELQAYARA